MVFAQLAFGAEDSVLAPHLNDFSVLVALGWWLTALGIPLIFDALPGSRERLAEAVMAHAVCGALSLAVVGVDALTSSSGLPSALFGVNAIGFGAGWLALRRAYPADLAGWEAQRNSLKAVPA